MFIMRLNMNKIIILTLISIFFFGLNSVCIARGGGMGNGMGHGMSNGSGMMMRNGERIYGYPKFYSKYGQRVAIKSKKQARLYIKDFYKENGYKHIRIIRIFERPHFFKIHVVSKSGKINDMLILNKYDGRIRFLNICDNNKMHTGCMNNQN